MSEQKASEKLSFYELLSRYRSHLMGIATLWVMYNHAMLMGLTATHQPFRFLQLAAHVSVDIFFLLSGFGIYHSLSRNNTRDYFIKRLTRLMPVWGSFLLIHIIVDKLVFSLSFSPKEIIGFLTFQGFAAKLGNQGNWYVYTIFLYYLIAPIPYSFLKESKHKLTTCAALVAVSWIASYSYFGNRDLLITFVRIPAFLIGMYLASAKEEAKDDKADRITGSICHPVTRTGTCICLGIAIALGALHWFILEHCSVDVLWDYGLWWHALIPMAAPLCLLFCRLFSLPGKEGVILKILSAIGKASLEVFLIHLYIFKYWGEITGILQQKSVAFRIGIWFFSILLGLLWHALLDLITKLIKKGKA
ncbi:MAG: acyltransferase [Lachnospiraceae bacterium]|nr:acyltransferase [Lachnospiraceae bacterium]